MDAAVFQVTADVLWTPARPKRPWDARRVSDLTLKGMPPGQAHIPGTHHAVLATEVMTWRTLLQVGCVLVGPPLTHSFVSMLWRMIMLDAQNCGALAAG